MCLYIHAYNKIFRPSAGDKKTFIFEGQVPWFSVDRGIIAIGRTETNKAPVQTPRYVLSDQQIDVICQLMTEITCFHDHRA